MLAAIFLASQWHFLANKHAVLAGCSAFWPVNCIFLHKKTRTRCTAEWPFCYWSLFCASGSHVVWCPTEEIACTQDPHKIHGRVRISGSLFANCECKFAFYEGKIIHFANDVWQKQCIKFYIKGWFSQSRRMYFTIMEDMEYFADYYCNFVLKICVKWRIWLQFLQKIFAMKRPPFCFSQAVFPLFKTEISFKFSRRKFANRFLLSNSNPAWYDRLQLIRPLALMWCGTTVWCPTEEITWRVWPPCLWCHATHQTCFCPIPLVGQATTRWLGRKWSAKYYYSSGGPLAKKKICGFPVSRPYLAFGRRNPVPKLFYWIMLVSVST
jgi:hypothetical protein